MENFITSSEVVNLYKQVESSGITIWIDGGWSVDALLEKQTRTHKDLDIAIQWKDMPKLFELLAAKGYKYLKEDGKWNPVWGGNNGHRIDIHAFVYDDKGKVIDGIMYPTESLTGTGIIDGQIVKCISPKYMVEFLVPWIHRWPEKYLDAVSALCEKFSIPLPKEYNQFKKN
jgi:lincosamide nucleotidyltransferase A/C/D/E